MLLLIDMMMREREKIYLFQEKDIQNIILAELWSKTEKNSLHILSHVHVSVHGWPIVIDCALENAWRARKLMWNEII